MRTVNNDLSVRLAGALASALSTVPEGACDEFIRGFVDGYLDLGYHTAFGITHWITVCVPADRYRHGYLVGQANRLSAN